MAAASAELGRPLMPHQRQILDTFLEVQSEEAGDPEPGEWAFDDGTATLPRRAGKTAIQSPLVTHRARLVRGAQMFMTAQDRQTARRRWLDITEDLLNSPLRGDVRRKVSITHEELRWIDGHASLIPFAPNKNAMHSETPDLVLVDEVRMFDAVAGDQLRAGYEPAFATTGGQALKISTQGDDESAWLNEETREGRRAVERGVRLGKFYAEWSLPDRIGGVLLKDLPDEVLVEAAIAHHPAVCHVPGCPGPRPGASRNRFKAPSCPHGFTIRASFLRTKFRPAARPEFIREYGNRSANDLTGAWLALDEAQWTRQYDTAGIPDGAPIALGVWVDEDGQDAALSAAFRGPDGLMRVEIPQTPVEQRDGASKLEPTIRAGVRWVADVVRYLVGRQTVLTLAIANTKGARDVADELAKIPGLHLTPVSQADVPAACSRHRSALEDGTWFHRVSVEATEAAKAADWQRHQWARPGESISALGAQTLAGWGFDHAPEPEETYGRFVIG